MTYFNDDTIAAIVTGQNVVSALGVIRISGAKSLAVAKVILKSKEGGALDALESHHLRRCLVLGLDGERIDDALAVWMKAPHTFTGEEVVELQMHGNPWILQKAMESLLARGIREALPGEFSFRAFRNGRISLDQAEAISDLITSENPESRKRALDQLLGKARHQIQEWKKHLVSRLAEVEVDIDFSDQGHSVIDYKAWALALENWCQEVEAVLREYQSFEPSKDGIRLAIVGAPNSGKSSLFNQLMGEERSIVSNLAGTTRDVVRERLILDGLVFRLSDTAGIRESEDSIESIGVLRSFGEVASAQVVLWVFDGAAYGGAESVESLWAQLKNHMSEGVRGIAIWNKADQSPKINAQWSSFFENLGWPMVTTSALKGEGLHSLRGQLVELFERKAQDGPNFVLNRRRHFEVITQAVGNVRAAIQKVGGGEQFPDLLAGDLRAALSSLSEVTGEFNTEDLLSHIFSEFCIGK